MTTLTTQKDLVVALKRETILTVGILSKLHPMSSELSNILKENALEKPAQNLFNHLSHYLVSIIDNQIGCGLPWPLYDIKTEKAFRNGISKFINVYSSRGLLSPVMSSYLVNPGSYKVILLLFQMSQLALQKTLLSKMYRENQRKLYVDMTENYKKQDKEIFIKNIEKETTVLFSRFSQYVNKREKMEKIAEVMCKRIKEMEEKLTSLEAQKYINELVDGFIKKYNVDDLTKKEILNIKNVSKPSRFIDAWLSDVDEKIIQLEAEWEKKMCPFLTLSSTTQNCTETLIARLTGKAEKSTYMLEYNPKTDDICTKDLQDQVNSEQKYILKNIVKNNQLCFPNLVRGFLIAVSFIQKNAEHGDEIFKFNEYLDEGRKNFAQMVNAVRVLLDRIIIIEAKLQSTPHTFNQLTPPKSFTEIPPLPDLSDLKMGKDLQSQIIHDTFTPLNISKYQFNLRRNINTGFAKPQRRSMLVTPLYQGPRDDFLKGLISCRVSSYDRPNITQNLNFSILSQTNLRNNETIAECSSGFTQQQITRLLSTKKSSSSKKFRYKIERPNNASVKKGSLFNESQHTSTDSNGLYRSYSSPNLYEHREKKSKVGRKLSVMQEDCPLLEVSGILALEKESSYATPESMQLPNARKIFDESSLPIIPMVLNKINTINDIDNNSQPVNFAEANLIKLKETASDAVESKTPKNNTQLIKKTNSLEKIINRFKKVRANVLPDTEKEEDFKTIVEENNTTTNLDVFVANRILLPDLLSPSYSVISKKSLDYLDSIVDVDEVVSRRPRESLGTALGVDHTFLDQFDLID